MTTKKLQDLAKVRRYSIAHKLQGLCLYCSRKLNKGSVCTTCLPKKRIANKKYRLKRLELGLCRSCSKPSVRSEWCNKHFEADRRRRLMRKYRLTKEEFDTLESLRNGNCMICKRSNLILQIDHNHVSGEVRGLLCGSCNTKLGWVETNYEAIMLHLGGL